MANIDNGVMLGALGSIHTDGTGQVRPPLNMVIVAIQFITKNTPTALVAQEPTRFIGTGSTVAHTGVEVDGTDVQTTDVGLGGVSISGCNFPAGMTIYGRWTAATFSGDSDGGVICYLGY